MVRIVARPTLVIVLVSVLAACSSGAATSASVAPQASPTEAMPMVSGDHADGFAWGEPADGTEAERVIEIRMYDELRFEPSSIEVRAGETVTLRVRNEGKIVHDFTLGDEAVQAEHDADMAAGGMAGMGHDEPNVMTVDPGKAGDLTWHFTAPGSIIYGCHIPGHYAAGMFGTLTITAP